MQTTYHKLEKILNLNDVRWEENGTNIAPSNLSVIAPQGDGMYGYQAPHETNPFQQAPTYSDTGGVIFFGNDINRQDFETLMQILDVVNIHHPKPKTDYAAFMQHTTNPRQDGYLFQMRLISKFGLRFMFNMLNEKEDREFPEQPINLSEALWQFMQEEKKFWGTSFTSEKLEGLFGGDGDYQREKLSFGFTVENSYYGVYRIWSRAWLVSK